ncbi:serum amyloid A protein-like [Sorex araneus]|uniref:serum amyloid A protein-like n=1 Tax=Sorex araneus TaxID=42254 RepID=UPI002433939B|nr:serum amyloid A protein-like [Sorex araneus]
METKMKLSTAIIFCSMILCVSSQSWFSFMDDFREGLRDSWRAYRDYRDNMQEENDRNFGKFIFPVTRENYPRITKFLMFGDSSPGQEDTIFDPFPKERGRIGNNPNAFRPYGLPEKY